MGVPTASKLMTLMARRDASLGAAELVAIGGRPDTP